MFRFFNLHKNIFFLGLVSLFNDFSVEMVQAVMPVFLSVTLGVAPLGIGLIEGVADAVASFLKVFSGWISDVIHKRKILAIFGYALSVSTRFFLAFAGTFSQVFSLRLADRFGKGTREAPRDALLAESVAVSDLGRSFGYQRAMDALGGMLGPLGAVLLLPILGGDYRQLFLVAFLVGILSVFSFVFVKENKTIPAIPQTKLNWAGVRRNYPFLLYITAVFIFSLGIMPITLMLLRLVEVGSTAASGLIFANVPLAYFLYSTVAVLLAIPFGRLSDRIGQRKVMVLGIGFVVIAYSGLAFSPNLAVALFFFAFLGLYPAATDGVGRALTARLIAPELLATGEGLFHMATGLGSLLAGLTGGLIWTYWGSVAALIYGASMAAVGLFFFIVIARISRRRFGG